MSQLEKRIEAVPGHFYRFRIALDHAPEPGERNRLELDIQTAMEQLGVPAEQVSVFAFMSVTPTGVDMVQEKEPRPGPDGRYLLCIMIHTEEGGFTEDPSVVAEQAVQSFAKFVGIPAKNIAAVVLENAYLEVETYNPEGMKVSVVNYAQVSGSRRKSGWRRPY